MVEPSQAVARECMDSQAHRATPLLGGKAVIFVDERAIASYAGSAGNRGTWMVGRKCVGQISLRSLILILAFATLAASSARATEIDPRCAPFHNSFMCACALQVGGDIHESRGGSELRVFYPKIGRAHV